MEILHVQRGCNDLQTGICKSNLETLAQPATASLNTCQAYACMSVGRWGIVPTLVNSLGGDFLLGRSRQTRAECLAELWADSCSLGSELNGNKLPKGRHDAPIIRPCRPRKSIQRFMATNRLEPESVHERTCRNDSSKESRLNSGRKPSGQKCQGLWLWVYRLTATRQATTTQSQSVEPKRIPYFGSDSEIKTPLSLLWEWCVSSRCPLSVVNPKHPYRPAHLQSVLVP